MRSRLPSWILLLYLAIDLANPFIPGAFRFTPEDGAVWVEGAPLSREDLRAVGPVGVRSSPASPRLSAGGELRGAPGPDRRGSLAAWLADVRSAEPPARDFPPPDADDH
jgi:hypothetical protein